MKNFTGAVNSEAIRERSTQFALVQPCSFLELPLIYTQGLEEEAEFTLRQNSTRWKFKNI